MSATSLFQSVVAWLVRTGPPSLADDAPSPYSDSSAPRADTYGNPVDDGGAGDRNRRDVEDRAREHQILISCWM
jgi:hypothetical protein